MNLALPALLLLALALPGFVFVYTYKGSLRNYNEPLVSSTAMSMGWVLGLVIGLASQTLWSWLATCLGYRVEFQDAIYLLSGHYEDHKEFSRVSASIAVHIHPIAAYFGSLYLFSGVLGYGLHHLIRRFKLDHRFGILKFNNTWHYIFYGEENGLGGAWVTVSIGHGDDACLYAGFLKQYVVLADGTLDRLVFRSPAYRISLPADPSVEPTHGRIDGDLFIVQCADINTLNVDYVFSEAEAEESAAGSTSEPNDVEVGGSESEV